MDKIHEWVNSLLIAVVLVLVLVGGNQSDPNIGATGTRFPNGLAVGSGASVDTTGAFSVGNDGSQIAEIISGTCNLSGPTAGLSASSTGIYQCAVTGASASDKVIVSLPGGANLGVAGKNDLAFSTTGNNLLVAGAAFASTSGAIGVEIHNFGAATTSFKQATTSVTYWLFR